MSRDLLIRDLAHIFEIADPYLYSLYNAKQSKVEYKLLCPRGTQTCALAVANIKVNGNTARR